MPNIYTAGFDHESEDGDFLYVVASDFADALEAVRRAYPDAKLSSLSVLNTENRPPVLVTPRVVADFPLASFFAHPAEPVVTHHHGTCGGKCGAARAADHGVTFVDDPGFTDAR